MPDLIRPESTADNPVEAAMTDGVRPVCDCPEPCACYAEGYAAGKDKAYFEVLASLEGPPHAEECGCHPCQMKRESLPPEGDDAVGQDVARAVRAGGSLGP